jgi:cytoskeletal protein CcmA (bactofilin family)
MWRKPNEVQPSPVVPGSQVQPAIKSEEAPKVPATVAPSPAPTPVPVSVSSNISKINAGLKIVGELSGNSDLYIEGEVQGKIRLANARVTVGPNGRVQAEIEAREIVVEGSVQGNLNALESAHLGPSSRVVGSVLAPRLAIDDGARLRGKVETTSPSRPNERSVVEPAAASLRPVTAGAKSE